MRHDKGQGARRFVERTALALQLFPPIKRIRAHRAVQREGVRDKRLRSLIADWHGRLILQVAQLREALPELLDRAEVLDQMERRAGESLETAAQIEIEAKPPDPAELMGSLEGDVQKVLQGQTQIEQICRGLETEINAM